MEALGNYCKRLVELKLKNWEFEDKNSFRKITPALENVENLNLSWTHLSKNVFIDLAKYCKQLKRVDLVSNLSDEDLITLAPALANTRELYIQENKLTIKSFKVLGPMCQNLETLDVAEERVEDEKKLDTLLPHLGRLKRFNLFDVSEFMLFKILKACPNLTYLWTENAIYQLWNNEKVQKKLKELKEKYEPTERSSKKQKIEGKR